MAHAFIYSVLYFVPVKKESVKLIFFVDEIFASNLDMSSQMVYFIFAQGQDSNANILD